MPDRFPPTPAHRRLREATRHEHAAAERTPVMQALLHGRLDAATYTRLLLGQYTMYRAWEAERAAWLHGELAAAGWRYASRSERLARDLADWGRSPEDEPSPLPAAPISQVIGNPSASWGELYVIEGSALGGQILARLLEQRFPGHAHHFFRIGQEAGRGTWRTFQSMLDSQLSNPMQQQAAIAAARNMFGRAQRMLEAVRA
ncbi:biliverdin-producing heme oxygenase [Dyella ginsengisoli]|uniref:Biliverdin-producing heme oxygenase n=1 Tax=Dyella ginsengisoli TaxID=363848 RepID=A0ABW8JRM1_9GAMM